MNRKIFKSLLSFYIFKHITCLMTRDFGLNLLKKVLVIFLTNLCYLKKFQQHMS